MNQRKLDKIIKMLYYLFIYLSIVGWISFIIIYFVCLIFNFSLLIPTIVGIIAFVCSILFLLDSVIIEKRHIVIEETRLEKKITKKDKKIEPDVFQSLFKTYKQLNDEINRIIDEYKFKLVNSKKELKTYIKSYHNSCYSIVVLYHLDSVNQSNKEKIIDTMNSFFKESIEGIKIGGLQLIYVIVTDQDGLYLKELLSEEKIIFDRGYTHKAIVCSSIKDKEIYLSKNYEPFIKGLYKKIYKYLNKNYKKIIK